MNNIVNQSRVEDKIKMTDEITVVINDEAKTIPGTINIQQLIIAQGLGLNSIALVCNGQVIPKSEWQTQRCHQEDHFEIFTVVAGG